MTTESSDTTILHVMSNPSYRGRHVVVVKGKVFTAKTGREANQLIDRLERQYPAERIAITYVPQADTLILWM